MTDEDVGSFLTHLDATLFDGGQHGVTGYGTLAIGEATDADVLRYLETHALGGIENADGSVVVDGKEGIRSVVHL